MRKEIQLWIFFDFDLADKLHTTRELNQQMNPI